MKAVAPLPIQRVNVALSVKINEKYDGDPIVGLNRFLADDFKTQNRIEKKDESKTLFSQMYKSLKK